MKHVKLIFVVIVAGLLACGYVAERRDRLFYEKEREQLKDKIVDLQAQVASQADALSRGGL